ncbi:MAG: hypothetical protein COA42_20950 [Alteromonadaceae bacterium]|nr:MAG: hypothetical protein COA42_20950 [Alteromonadaceae bacterium]
MNNNDTQINLIDVNANFIHDVATPLAIANMNIELLEEYLPTLLALQRQQNDPNSIPDHLIQAISNAPKLVKDNLASIQHEVGELKSQLKSFSENGDDLTIKRVNHKKEDIDLSNGKLKNINNADAPPTLDILLVDDETIHQDLGRSVLKNHRVDVAENGLSAVECCQIKNYDVILMDMQMPKLDGCQATERIRSFAPASTVIIGLTNMPIHNRRETLENMGFTDFLEKPLKLDILMSILQDIGLK